MKRYRVLLCVVLSMIFGISMVTNSSSQVAYAKTKMTMSTFPKSIRGTWYSYQYHHMYRYKITSKKIVLDGYVSRLHSRKNTYVVKPVTKVKHPSWVIARILTKEHWINVYGWYQGSGDGDSYRRVIHKVGGHKRSILQLAGGAGFETNGHGYHSKQLAKKYANHYFKGERRLPE